MPRMCSRENLERSTISMETAMKMKKETVVVEKKSEQRVSNFSVRSELMSHHLETLHRQSFQLAHGTQRKRYSNSPAQLVPEFALQLRVVVVDHRPRGRNQKAFPPAIAARIVGAVEIGLQILVRGAHRS